MFNIKKSSSANERLLKEIIKNYKDYTRKEIKNKSNLQASRPSMLLNFVLTFLITTGSIAIIAIFAIIAIIDIIDIRFYLISIIKGFIVRKGLIYLGIALIVEELGILIYLCDRLFFKDENRQNQLATLRFDAWDSAINKAIGDIEKKKAFYRFVLHIYREGSKKRKTFTRIFKFGVNVVLILCCIPGLDAVTSTSFIKKVLWFLLLLTFNCCIDILISNIQNALRNHNYYLDACIEEYIIVKLSK